jgi:hypothetical protein
MSVAVLARSRPCVVLGVAPASKGERAWSPESASGRRLAELADASPIATKRLERYFALDNLVPYPDPSRRALREAAELYRFLPVFWYVLAGTEVVRALGHRARPMRGDKLPWSLTGPDPLCWYESGEGVIMAVLPHPSGKNRWYNDKRCRAAATAFLREARWTRGGRPRHIGAHAVWERAREEASR